MICCPALRFILIKNIVTFFLFYYPGYKADQVGQNKAHESSCSDDRAELLDREGKLVISYPDKGIGSSNDLRS